jgi:predicted O-methyltransferase YrrM
VKKFLLAILPIADVILAPLVFLAGCLLKGVRRAGVERMPLSKKALLQVGVFPIRNHYYEPLFDPKGLTRPLDEDRLLPGIDWNIQEQLELLRSFSFNEELRRLAAPQGAEPSIFQSDAAANFESGDAEFLYNFIRKKKPARVFEIGSGKSTRIAAAAIRRNRDEAPGYRCKHVCIEPYEAPWLEQTGATVIRRRVEEVGSGLFGELSRGDFLFIDSSHVLRPQGDVVFEYLELLPSLKPGVVVHVHDIFSPKDYPREWVVDQVRFWNEQYVLEAFLTCNRDWKVVAALNLLHHHHFEKLQGVCPFLTPDREPGSFYMEKK